MKDRFDVCGDYIVSGNLLNQLSQHNEILAQRKLTPEEAYQMSHLIGFILMEAATLGELDGADILNKKIDKLMG
jgi:hypothetical protein